MYGIWLFLSNCLSAIASGRSKAPVGSVRRIGRIIDDVHTGETHPYIASRNIHAVVVVKLHLTSLVAASFKAIVNIGARSSRRDEKTVWLAIIHRGRVVAVVMHRYCAGGWIEVI